jgi:dTDP-4-amino-4,6-dideoxygalactose transaminase
MREVKFNDLTLQIHKIKDLINENIETVLESNAFIKGNFVKQFEDNFKKYSNVKHAIGVSNGTDALLIAMESLKSTGDVLVQPTTYVASASMIPRIGNEVKFIDVNRDTWQISTENISDKITKNTVGLIGVHLYGFPFDVENIFKFLDQKNIWMIEDSAQSHGAKINGKNTGTFGQIATYSFFPGKNLGAFGDAGAITTDDDELAILCRKLADGGRLSKYEHEILGWNSRLDTIHAAVLDSKLTLLEEWNIERRKIAKIYDDTFSTIEQITLPKKIKDTEPVYHLYPILVENRENFINYLKEEGISTGIHYPIPLHLQKAFSYLGHKEGDFPNSEKICFNEVSLPIYPYMEEEDVNYVCEKIKQYFKKT